MKNTYKSYALIISFLGSLIACNSSKNNFDATGVFEATEVIVSAEANGKLLDFNVIEGANLKKGQALGQIDCKNIDLQKSQTQASINALKLKENEATPQLQIIAKQIEAQATALASQKAQLEVYEKERLRLQKLVKAEAAPSKQLDDMVGMIDVLKKQMANTQSQMDVLRQQSASQKEQVNIQNRGITSEKQPLEVQISRIDEQLGHCQIINPIDGTVLVKYAEANEIASIGKPLYKIANLDTMILRAYISGTQLGQVKLNQKVRVFVDNGKDTYKETSGVITWISSDSEFTPKTIQTKDERANLVYAVKVSVKNDGFIKIGMYGEVKFQ